MGQRSIMRNNTARQLRVLPHISTVKHIGIALFDGFALPETASIVDVFHSANRLAEKGKQPAARYNVRLLSAAGDKVVSSSSVFVCTESAEASRHADRLHALFIAGGASLHSSLHDVGLIKWLHRMSPGNEHVYSSPEARLLLEAAGLTQPITKRESIDCHNNVLRQPVGENSRLKPTSQLQLALDVIHEDLGPDIASQIAAEIEHLGETPFTGTVRKNNSAIISEQILASARWLEANGDQAISMSDAARVAAMSERNFLRRFKMEMGLTPSDYLQQVRLDMSCRLLLKTDLPVDKIARRCGFDSGGRLSKLFRSFLAMTPTEYRSNRRQARSCRNESLKGESSVERVMPPSDAHSTVAADRQGSHTSLTDWTDPG
ncbi:helix-turn-helix domain-containing protein [Paraburkholderia dipogonis]|uniref:helix-turn-helix domain-containing protein n=1 Tax=Paraburkholderia dipogonis TaxID=1211383 RepID=UPI0038BB988C